MVLPQYLVQGDVVAMTSTARYVSKLEIDRAYKLICSWGLKVFTSKSIDKVYRQFSGDDIVRAEALQEVLDNHDIKAVWCAKGGYGTIRIMDKLDFSKFIESPKWIIGYSDVTVLLSKVELLGISSIHGPMPSKIHSCTPRAIQSLKNALFGQGLQYVLDVPDIKDFNVKGQVVGGNLSILYSLLGSQLAIDTTNKILIIEDLDEYLYHIDRMLINLKNNGYLSKIKALLVGGMIDMHDNNVPFGKTAKQIILEHTQDYGYPVVFDLPFGHISDNCCFYLGKQISLSCKNQKLVISYQDV